MKLTNRSEYALLALISLAREFEGGDLLSADEIANAQGIPKRFLQQILFTLKRGGYVSSVKGHEGGYALLRSPATITIAEVVRFFEGALAPSTAVSKNFYEPSPIENETGLVRLFTEVREAVADILEDTTLADVCKKSAVSRRR